MHNRVNIYIFLENTEHLSEKAVSVLDKARFLCYTCKKSIQITLPPGRKCEAFTHIVRSLKMCRECFFVVKEPPMFFKKAYFTKAEIALWLSSVAMIFASFFLFGGDSLLSLAASLIGVSSLLLIAKGNPIGQLLTILFSVFYGIISYSFAYYGEMLTYLCMTAPMALLALITWLKHPFEGNKSEVEIAKLTKKDLPPMLLLTAAVTGIFYFILEALNTANLVPSTVSVTTSFLAVYLTYKRSPYYALAYAANDLVLIVLWTLASLENRSYISVVVCFAAFFLNDLYGFANWQKRHFEQIEKKRREG